MVATIKYPQLHDEQWIRNKYLTERLNQRQIAELLNCTHNAVQKALQRFNIETRPQENFPGSNAPRPRKNLDTLHNEEWLIDQYVTQNKPANQIATELGVSHPTVFWALEKFEIPIRRQYLPVQQNFAEVIEKLQNREWLSDQYLNQKKTVLRIAAELNISRRKVELALRRANITIRSFKTIERKSSLDTIRGSTRYHAWKIACLRRDNFNFTKP